MLNQRGYYTAMFQGTLKNTSGTGAFSQSLGFRHSYGKKDVAEYQYPHNSWGLQDPDLYRFVVKKLKQMPQPFFVGINTNSTHSSELPPGITPRFKGNSHDTTYINMLHFSDAALKNFINEVEQDPAFKDTIFILVADHAGPSLGDSILNKYLVPFLAYAPGIIRPRQLEVVSSQRDIAPTLLQLLNIPDAPNFSGSSLLDSAPQPYADYYHQGTLGWVEGQTGVEFRLDKPDSMRCYGLKTQPFKQQSIDCSLEQKQQHRRALAFTHVSQSLLFNGKIDGFRSFISGQ
jgi:phosphoglycerol transferase MdoB-like AlkP superfamily enzyme